MSVSKIPHRRPLRSGKSSTIGEKISENIRSVVAQFFGGRRVAVIIGAIIGVVAVAGIATWYLAAYSSPSRTFWGMVNNNLSTYGVTNEVTQNAQGVTSDAITQLSFGAKPAARSVKEVANSGSKITVESIGTPTDTYQHYVSVSQPIKDAKHKPDYSKVYSLWIKDGGHGQKGDPSLFSSALFGGFLFGNLSPAQKAQVIHDLSNSYSIDYSRVQTKVVNLRKAYTYNVTLALKPYAKAANDYAKSLGLPKSVRINPDSYSDSDKVALKVSIDVLSRQLRSVSYQSNSTTEIYSGYGIHTNYNLPAHTVSYSTLQNAVVKAANSATKK